MILLKNKPFLGSNINEQPSKSQDISKHLQAHREGKYLILASTIANTLIACEQFRKQKHVLKELVTLIEMA